MRGLRAVAFAALFVIQIVPSATVAWQQARRLATGRPIRLAVEARDPRDAFRGEYSTLAYEIANLNGIEAVAPLPSACDLAARASCSLVEQTVYVRLVADAHGVDRAVNVTFGRLPKGDVFIAGKVTYGSLLREGESFPGGAVCRKPACATGFATYGIETWYGPQGRPAELDKAARQDVTVEARVDDDGTAVLDGIRVGGKPFAKTPRLWPLGE